MPRSSRAVAERNRSAILDEAVDEASTQGLEGLTIGALADRLSMSKAGVIGPFGSKEKLQLAALDRAGERFAAAVWEPAADLPPGLPRLQAVLEAWLTYLGGSVFPGGCFITQAAAEFDGRSGPVREAVQRTGRLWDRVLERELATAVERGELPELDPAQVSFELGAIAQGVNQAIQLHADPKAIERGRRAMRRALRLVD